MAAPTIVHTTVFPAVTTNSASGTIPTTTTGNTLLIIATWKYLTGTGASPTATDSAGDTYTKLLSNFTSDFILTCDVLYARNIVGAATPTVTYNSGTNGTLTELVVTVYEIAGSDPASPIPDHVSTNGGSTTPSSGSVTNTNPSSLMFSVALIEDTNNPATLTPGAGWTDQNGLKTSGVYAADIATKAVSTSASQSNTWTSGVNTAWSGLIFAVQAVNPPSMAASPTSLNTGTTGNVVTLTGTNTAWVAGTTTFSISGVAGCSITSQSCTSATAGTITVSTGATAGTLTVSDSLDAATASVTVVAAPLVVRPNDANWFFSRNNWLVSGSSYAASGNPGAKFALAWSVPAGGAGQFTLTVDTTPEGGASLAAGSYPSLEYSVDGGALTTVQLAGNSATTTPINLTGLAANATHTIICWFKDTDGTVGDRWTTPVQQVKVVSATLDNGAATVPLSGTNLAIQAGECLVFGDSITEGDFAGGTGVTNGDGMLVFGQALARALACEASIVAFGGQGFTKTGNAGTNVPTFHTAGAAASQSWQWFWSGQSRLSGGLFAAMPSHIVLFHGFNDNGSTDAAVTAAVSDCLTQLRTACGSAKTHIHVVLPVAPKKHTAISAGYTNYQAATPDALTHLYDLTTLYGIPLLSAELNGVGAATFYSYDGTHPNATTHGVIATLMADAIRHRLDGPRRIGLNGGI